jgi:hypothetical protein
MTFLFYDALPVTMASPGERILAPVFRTGVVCQEVPSWRWLGTKIQQ